jgi:uncharacterized protein YbaP (TraB family)
MNKGRQNMGRPKTCRQRHPLSDMGKILSIKEVISNRPDDSLTRISKELKIPMDHLSAVRLMMDLALI